MIRAAIKDSEKWKERERERIGLVWDCGKGKEGEREWRVLERKVLGVTTVGVGLVGPTRGVYMCVYIYINIEYLGVSIFSAVSMYSHHRSHHQQAYTVTPI